MAYNGSADYAVIRQFKEDGEVLISTDNGAKGFNLEEAAFIIHYDLLYNTLKLEQRIDRSHRLGQENDVLSVAFIDKNNFADVRKLELINKRMLVTDGVFGITDDLLGGFTDDVKAAFPVIAQRLRPRAQIEQAYRQALSTHEEDNRQTVSAAEDILFTTFTKELAAQLERLSPAQAEETERMKRQVSADKAALSRELNTLDSQVQQAQVELEAVTGDRLKRLAAQKKINQLRQEYMKRQESQFFDAMRLDMELEEKIKSFADKEKLTARVQREFVVTMRRNI